MALILEITKADGSVVTSPIKAGASEVVAQPGDHFRVVDSVTGQEPADLIAVRDGQNLVIEGLPEIARLALCDFFKPGEHEACTLALESGEVIAPTVAPVQIAQKDAAKDAAKEMADKKAAEMKDKAGSTAEPAKAGTATETAEKATAATEADAAAAAANPAFSTTGVAIGAIALVGVAAAAGGGDDSPTPAPPPGPPPGPAPAAAPPAPVVSDLAAAELGGDNAVGFSEQADGIIVSGTAEAGSTVAVTLVDGTSTATAATASGVADASGNYSVTIPGGDGTDLDGLDGGSYAASVTATNATGTSPATTGTAFTLLPQSPNFVDIEGADSVIDIAELASDGAITVTGTSEAGATLLVELLDGTSTVVATAPVANADASTGAFTAQIPSAGLTGSGLTSYTIRTTTSNNGLTSDAPNSQGMQIDYGLTAGAGDTTVVGGNSTGITGSDGNNVLIGDFGGIVQGSNFDFWDATVAGFSYNAATSAFFAQPHADTAAQTSLGWTPVIGGPQVTTETNHYNYAEGAVGPPAAPDEGDGRVELIAYTGDGGSWAWDTALDNFYGGGGVTQTINTVTGEGYQLQISVDTASLTENTVLEVFWADSSLFTAPATSDDTNGVPTAIATRAADGSWDNAPSESTSGGLTIWTWALPSAAVTSDSTELRISAHEQWNSSGGGDTQGLQITNVALSHAGAENDDVIDGGLGNDVIIGQGGNDTLTGGAGADSFVFSLNMDSGTNTVVDLVSADGDRVVLTDVMNEVGGARAFAEPESSNLDLTVADLVNTTTAQTVTVAADGSGDVMLTFGGTEASGSVTLTGIKLDDYDGPGTFTQEQILTELLGLGTADQVLDMTMNGLPAIP